ncbi:hypothetical protein CYY_008353 [Polysphondylium violaceum]|uniref:Uncharacterized protein n=1 Tax=Polysphondylium violaceum TaxID=133409 RepID=A0A8J4UQ82_9MYCE|nr:hypothetical protein CYY_008353 [Polysphondylium violaceum]
MIIERYREVFSSKYLATKIFDIVREIQRDRFPLKYNDIVDVGWMLKHGHVGLAKEKIKNDEHLYVNPEDLYSIVASTDTQMFIYLFERYKYYVLPYYYDTECLCCDTSKVNHDVIYYLFENGHTRDLFAIETIDIKFVQHLLEKGLLRPTPTFLIKYDDGSRRNTKNYTKELVDLVAKYTPSPIHSQDIQAIAEYMLKCGEKNLCYFIFDALSPLFIKDPVISVETTKKKGKGALDYQQVLQEVQQLREAKIKFDNKKKNKADSKTQNRSGSEWLVAVKDPAFEFDSKSIGKMWFACIEESEAVFFAMWQALSRRIKVTNTHVHFYQANDLTHDDHYLDSLDANDLDDDERFTSIGPILIDTACQVGSIKILDMLIERGHTFIEPHLSIQEYEDEFYQALLEKKPSQEELGMLAKLYRYKDNDLFVQHWCPLLQCCIYGQAEYFEYLYPLLEDLREDLKDVPDLYHACFQYKRYHMLKLLESRHLFLSDYVPEFLEYGLKYSFARTLGDIDRISAGAACPKEFFTICLKSALQCGDLISVKYIFSKRKFDTLNKSTMAQLYQTQNLAIIDYINKNRSQCFTQAGLNNIHTFFRDLFLFKESPNVPLMEYLIQENCVDSKLIRRQPFFDPNIKIDKKHSFRDTVYLIDHRNYASLDSCIQVLLEREDWAQCLEYIYKNQHRFQTKQSFQSIFDHIIINLTSKSIKRSIDKLYALVHRYECVLNDSHYQYLHKLCDGLTLFGIIPNSIFVSNDYRSTNRLASSRPLKRQKK